MPVSVIFSKNAALVLVYVSGNSLFVIHETSGGEGSGQENLSPEVYFTLIWSPKKFSSPNSP